ncbi:MAG: dimethylarginine dimethylaminohydrolase family protein [Candidatus Hodarchaeota archaeon]
MNFQHALVREPGENFSQCITSHPLKHSINVSNAKKQHFIYCNILIELGLEVIHLPIDNVRPDSCFVEDTAIIHNKKALITRMGVESRRGEVESVEDVLKDYMETEKAVDPATIEGGDVIHLPDRLVCGLTQRTNSDGVNQMGKWLNVKVDTINDPNIIHLKSYLTYLGNGLIIATNTYANHPILEDYDILIVTENESYAANTLTIGNSVLLPRGFPNTQKMLTEAGFQVIPLDMSEFQKCEGALTCLSLLF